MTLHPSAFEYLKPTDKQIAVMSVLRKAALEYYTTLDLNVLDGPDKTYLLRKLREVAMWANIAVTREADGTPRD